MRDKRTNEQTNIEDRATQPMEAGGWVSQFKLQLDAFQPPWCFDGWNWVSFNNNFKFFQLFSSEQRCSAINFECSFMNFSPRCLDFFLRGAWVLPTRCLDFTSKVLEWVGLGGVYCRFRFNLLLFLALCTCTLHLKQISSCIKCTLLSNGATISI